MSSTVIVEITLVNKNDIRFFFYDQNKIKKFKFLIR